MPTVRMRRLGWLLKSLREEANLTHEKVTAVTGISRATLSRFEGGKGKPKLRDLRLLLDLYAVPADKAAELVAYTQSAHESGWWAEDPYEGVSSPEMEFYISLEEVAERIFRWTSSGVHGLLQTAEYARAVELRRRSPEGLVDQIVDLRLARQQHALDPSHPGRIRTVLDEAALRRKVGSSAVMAGQCQHLVDLARRRDDITIQILPFSAGLGFYTDFTVFTLPDGEQVGATDGPFGVTHVDHPRQLSSLNVDWGVLTEAALPPGASIALIDAIAKEYSNESPN